MEKSKANKEKVEEDRIDRQGRGIDNLEQHRIGILHECFECG